MDNNSIDEIEDSLKKKLSNHRYRHTMGVAYTCACLAMSYQADVNQAYLAGLLHDCAKHYEDSSMLEKCIDNNIDITEFEKEHAYLLHAKLGAYYCHEKYNINDIDIINAVRYHTTGHADMTLLEKIVFVADYIEPGRDKAANLDEIRMISFKDIDMAVYMIARDTLIYLNDAGRDIDTTTNETYEFYKKEKEQ